MSVPVATSSLPVEITLMFQNKHESDVMEIDYVRNELVVTINNLENWTKPEKVIKVPSA